MKYIKLLRSLRRCWRTTCERSDERRTKPVKDNGERVIYDNPWYDSRSWTWSFPTGTVLAPHGAAAPGGS
jgi:hypothetical protein